eukprot:GHVU01111817.1.p1 GENE.GHVU01111817.1~~GHVU01111817.1.p1  ORF type:complete len:246 (-),score=23.31 GHVU01111817.1:363-1100(-)
MLAFNAASATPTLGSPRELGIADEDEFTETPEDEEARMHRLVRETRRRVTAHRKRAVSTRRYARALERLMQKAVEGERRGHLAWSTLPNGVDSLGHRPSAYMMTKTWEAKEEQELRECTFQPSTNPAQKSENTDLYFLHPWWVRLHDAQGPASVAQYSTTLVRETLVSVLNTRTHPSCCGSHNIGIRRREERYEMEGRHIPGCHHTRACIHNCDSKDMLHQYLDPEGEDDFLKRSRMLRFLRHKV